MFLLFCNESIVRVSPLTTLNLVESSRLPHFSIRFKSCRSMGIHRCEGVHHQHFSLPKKTICLTPLKTDVLIGKMMKNGCFFSGKDFLQRWSADVHVWEFSVERWTKVLVPGGWKSIIYCNSAPQWNSKFAANLCSHESGLYFRAGLTGKVVPESRDSQISSSFLFISM